ncbi:MAG: TRAP transporter small permease subunit [Paracoccaceae bacterium]|nr:TRAP transporter small permease subunit [Paracoccaceae bacterium]
MGALIGAAKGLAMLNGALLALGRWLGAFLLASMVAAILAQVWYRYVLGNALAWPDEAARFLMLWMTGLMAPTAFRRGGFVAIDMIQLLFPRAVAAVLQLALLALSLLVLVTAFRIGLSELSGLGARFATSSLWYPSGLFPLEWAKVPRGWMMTSFHVGVTLLLLVNVELLLRALLGLFGRGAELPVIAQDTSLAGAE